MGARPSRYLTDRDLRSLSTADLLALMEQDARDLDRAWREQHRTKPAGPPPAPTEPPRAKSGRGKRLHTAGAPQVELFEPEPEHAAFHSVACCDVYMGDFPAIARVRCKFCGSWHRAGDFPVKADEPA